MDGRRPALDLDGEEHLRLDYFLEMGRQGDILAHPGIGGGIILHHLSLNIRGPVRELPVLVGLCGSIVGVLLLKLVAIPTGRHRTALLGLGNQRQLIFGERLSGRILLVFFAAGMAVCFLFIFLLLHNRRIFRRLRLDDGFIDRFLRLLRLFRRRPGGFRSDRPGLTDMPEAGRPVKDHEDLTVQVAYRRSFSVSTGLFQSVCHGDIAARIDARKVNQFLIPEAERAVALVNVSEIIIHQDGTAVRESFLVEIVEQAKFAFFPADPAVILHLRIHQVQGGPFGAQETPAVFVKAQTVAVHRGGISLQVEIFLLRGNQGPALTEGAGGVPSEIQALGHDLFPIFIDDPPAVAAYRKEGAAVTEVADILVFGGDDRPAGGIHKTPEPGTDVLHRPESVLQRTHLGAITPPAGPPFGENSLPVLVDIRPVIAILDPTESVDKDAAVRHLFRQERIAAVRPDDGPTTVFLADQQAGSAAEWMCFIVGTGDFPVKSAQHGLLLQGIQGHAVVVVPQGNNAFTDRLDTGLRSHIHADGLFGDMGNRRIILGKGSGRRNRQEGRQKKQ